MNADLAEFIKKRRCRLCRRRSEITAQPEAER